jgi:hypothetical protein
MRPTVCPRDADSAAFNAIGTMLVQTRDDPRGTRRASPR